MAIDWAALSESMGLIEWTASGTMERGSPTSALAALEQIIGPDELRAAADYWLAGERGSELARQVLWLLRPASARERCLDVYRTAETPEERMMALSLLKYVGDVGTLAMIPEFLADPDWLVQKRGADVLDQLLMDGVVRSEDCADLIAMAESHPNPLIGAMWGGRELTDEFWAAISRRD